VCEWRGGGGGGEWGRWEPRIKWGRTCMGNRKENKKEKIGKGK